MLAAYDALDDENAKAEIEDICLRTLADVFARSLGFSSTTDERRDVQACTQRLCSPSVQRPQIALSVLATAAISA